MSLGVANNPRGDCGGHCICSTIDFVMHATVLALMKKSVDLNVSGFR